MFPFGISVHADYTKRGVKTNMPTGVYKRSQKEKERLINMCKNQSEETIQKRIKTRKKLGLIPPNRKGIPLSEEHKKKIGKANKGNKNNLGKVCSEETRRKISEAQKGEKSHNWKGGISYQPYPDEWTNSLKDSIRERDKYTCQECGIHQDELNGRFKKLDIHHIDYNKDNLNPDNLITLCKSCHSKTNNNREYWIEYFNN